MCRYRISSGEAEDRTKQLEADSEIPMPEASAQLEAETIDRSLSPQAGDKRGPGELDADDERAERDESDAIAMTAEDEADTSLNIQKMKFGSRMQYPTLILI